MLKKRHEEMRDFKKSSYTKAKPYLKNMVSIFEMLEIQKIHLSLSSFLRKVSSKVMKIPE